MFMFPYTTMIYYESITTWNAEVWFSTFLLVSSELTHFALPCSCRQNANEIDVWGLTWVRRMLHYIKFWLFVKIVQCNITLIDRRLVLQYTYIFELILTDLFELKEQPQPHAEIRVILWEITGKSCRFLCLLHAELG